MKIPSKKADKAPVTISEVAPSYLVESPFYNELRADQKRRVIEIDTKFHQDTNGELTTAEYYNLATLQYMIEDIDKNIQKKGGVEKVEPELLTDLRDAKKTVNGIMSKWRENKKTNNGSLGSIQEAIIKMKGPGGSVFTVDIKKDEGEVINLDDPRVVTLEPHEAKEVSDDGGDDPRESP
jgi:hypothetical protein